MNFPNPDRIFQIEQESNFNNLCLEIFQFQAKNIPIYQEYLKYLKINVATVNEIEKIPFLPISFFKSHKISSIEKDEIIFRSSGTTGSIPSKHYIGDLSIYEKSFIQGFSTFYGEQNEFALLALLPSYLERDGSSLVYMVEELIKISSLDSGFYLFNHEELYEKLLKLKALNKPTLLIGVTFALLDFAEKFQLNFPELIVMDTGGMKGKRKEMIREEVHNLLKNSFGVSEIHSEYGMTELLSQAYSKGNGIFETPKWMQIKIRDTNDPFTYLSNNKTGGINIIDLANVYSCSFIATQDLGLKHENGTFEVKGRFDNSDIRGCNLMIE